MTPLLFARRAAGPAGASRLALPALAAVAVLAALSAACNSSGTPPRAPAETAPAPTVDVVRLFKTPEDVEAFTVTDLDGGTHSSADWRGKVVLVNFWATWCPPCREEIPDLIELQNKYRDDLIVVGISEDTIPVDQVKQFAVDKGMNYTVGMTSPEIKKIFHSIAALPTTFVIDRDGRLAQKHVGMLNPVMTEAETRVLAGIDTTTRVERVDGSDKARIESAAQAKNIPGIDLAALNETQQKAVLQALIAEQCTCGCELTVAVCRLDDPTCPVSLPMAQEIVKKYSAMP
jgi:thiol-disulfide isomerase/thioredoxin